MAVMRSCCTALCHEDDHSANCDRDWAIRSRTTKPSNPKEAVGDDKLPLHLWPETATIYGSLGLLDGMLKYGRANWRSAGVRASTYYNAVRRHLNAWFEGEDNDPDSGLHHLAHALACIAILVDAKEAGKLNDDRQYPGGYRAAVDRNTPHVARLKALHGDKSPTHYTIGTPPGDAFTIASVEEVHRLTKEAPRPDTLWTMTAQDLRDAINNVEAPKRKYPSVQLGYGEPRKLMYWNPWSERLHDRVPRYGEFSKEETIAFDQVLQGFGDAMVLSNKISFGGRGAGKSEMALDSLLRYAGVYAAFHVRGPWGFDVGDLYDGERKPKRGYTATAERARRARQEVGIEPGRAPRYRWSHRKPTLESCDYDVAVYRKRTKVYRARLDRKNAARNKKRRAARVR